MSDFDKLLLFLHFNIPCLIKISCWRKKHILNRFYKKSTLKFYDKLNVFRILSKLDDLIMMEQYNELKDKNSQWIFKHHKRNVINCDMNDSSSDCSES